MWKLFAVISSSLLVLSSCSGPDDSLGDPEICDDDVDNDQDGNTDCEDDDCASEGSCLPTDEICDDGDDNDGDGNIDCADDDCMGDPACPEICDDGDDNDDDGDIDCDDDDCLGNPVCPEVCDDDVDNDGDGDIDCADDDCVGLPICPEICDNGVDDDGNGEIDCYDPNCPGDAICVEECANDHDDDGDGAMDCYDLDCPGAAACPEDCANDHDDDGNGLSDCADDACVGAEGCFEVCDNDRDDDGDELVDCADDDCIGVEGCPEVCDNDRDDDGDGATDCADDDCIGVEGCPEVCDNDRDDDGDGAIDCADDDCIGVEGCPEVCDNDRDDDGDGAIDCADDDCIGDPACPEVCDNDRDDDGDGATDCADDDCIGDPACPEVCDNDRDDDGDGTTDCADSDCIGDPACPEICDNDRDDDGDELVDCMDPDCDVDAACPELCNGEDDDGDGRIDELPSDGVIGDDCYEGPPAVRGIGMCTEGTIRCFGGELTCIGWVAPAAVELCDGLDSDCDGEIPADEAISGCSTVVVVDRLARIEFMTEVRDVDVQFNLDTTGSMGGELDALRDSLSTTIVPAIRDALPTSEFGVSTFDDFPVNGFGDGGDTPFTLHQRVTSSVPRVQEAIDEIPDHSGNDGPESGIESLYQIATGEGTSWPLDAGGADCPRPAAGSDWATAGEISPAGDFDAYTISLAAGDRLTVDIDASEAGSSLDPYLYLHSEDGTQLTRNDDTCGLDSFIGYTADAAIDLVIIVRGYGDSSTGWYVMHVNVDDQPYVAEPDACSDLEVGGNPFAGGFDPDLTVPLVTPDEIFPRPDGDACADDCEDELGGDATVGWITDFCRGLAGGEGECGNGEREAGEECDDGNLDDGDGCDSSCRSERGMVPEFNWEDGYDTGLGHGPVGGVGFRETSLPVIVHITDAVAHECEDYDGYDIDAHCADETFEALNDVGARVVVVSSGVGGSDPVDLHRPLGMVTATDSIVPVCAFDDSDARTSGVCAAGQCCTGQNGASVAPNADGECPLVFQINSSGVGLGNSIVDAIDALTRYVQYELTVDPIDDPTDEVDALCFIDSIEIDSFVGPPGDCGVSPDAVDTDGDGHDDTLVNATPRTRVTFVISAVNRDINDVDGDGNRAEACAGTGTYGLLVDVVAEGGTVVATRRIDIEVP
jgi:hypothetical protein